MRSGQLDFLWTCILRVFGKVRGAEEDFDVDMAYGHLIRDMAARDHGVMAALRSGRRTQREFVTENSSEHSLRIHRGHFAPHPVFKCLCSTLYYDIWTSLRRR